MARTIDAHELEHSFLDQVTKSTMVFLVKAELLVSIVALLGGCSEPSCSSKTFTISLFRQADIVVEEHRATSRSLTYHRWRASAADVTLIIIVGV